MSSCSEEENIPNHKRRSRRRLDVKGRMPHVPHITLDASMCGFMLFHGRESQERITSLKYKNRIGDRIVDAYRIKRVADVNAGKPRSYEYLDMFFFRVDENNALMYDCDGKPIHYYGKKRYILKELSLKEVRRYDHTVKIRLMYNSPERKTKVSLIELGFGEMEFYSKDISLETLETYVPDKVLLNRKKQPT